MPYNDCSQCAQKAYTQTLCSECADRFCLNTCGAVYDYEDHQEPTVCPKCHKIRTFSYYESPLGLHIPVHEPT